MSSLGFRFYSGRTKPPHFCYREAIGGLRVNSLTCSECVFRTHCRSLARQPSDQYGQLTCSGPRPRYVVMNSSISGSTDS